MISLKIKLVQVNEIAKKLKGVIAELNLKNNYLIRLMLLIVILEFQEVNAQTSCNFDICSNFTRVTGTADCPSLADAGLFFTSGFGALPSGTPSSEWVGFHASDTTGSNESFDLNLGVRTAGTYTLSFYYATAWSPGGTAVPAPGRFHVDYNGITLLNVTSPLSSQPWKYITTVINHTGGNMTIRFDGTVNGGASIPLGASYTHIADINLRLNGDPKCPSSPSCNFGKNGPRFF